MTAAPGPRSRRPRAAANYGPQRGTTYLIHIDPPYKHDKHYKGWTDRPVAQRFADHLAGRGALLTRLAVQAGSRLTLARVWPNTTKDREDAIKRSGGKRMCPECGVTPGHTRLASDKAPEPDDRRPRWQYDRDGEWADDGTPIIYDPEQTYAQARAEAARHPVPEPGPAGQAELAALDELQRQWTNQEDQVGLRNAIARGAAAMRGVREAHERAASAREADRLWAIADALDRQMGRRPGYQHELTAERAARIRARIGVDLAVDARIEATPRAEGEPLVHWAITPDDVAQAGREPVLQGAELDAEIDRLADALPEPGPADAGQTPQGLGRFISPWARYDPELYRPHFAAGAVIEAPGEEPGKDAATWSAALGDVDPDAEVNDFPYLTERPADPDAEPGDDALQDRAAYAEALRQAEARALARQHIAQEERDAAGVTAAREEANAARYGRLATQAEAYDAAAALQDAALIESHAEPMEHMSAEAGHSRTVAPTAAAQPAGTPHTDPALGERGWQADSHGVYVRNPDAEAPGAHCGLAGYEAGTSDHMYGSPQCAEADPEGDHFGRGPDEPMDTGRWPVLQADYGRMYIGPQAQAEAV